MNDVASGIPIPRTSEQVYTSKRDGKQVQWHQAAGAGGPIFNTAVTVTTTPTPIPAVNLPNRVTLYTEVQAGTDTYFGGPNVTAAPGGGLKLASGSSRTWLIGESDLWAIVATGTSTVACVEVAGAEQPA